MNLAQATWQAFLDNDGPGQTLVHIELSLTALVLAVAIGLALGTMCAKLGRTAAFALTGLANLGRTIPTFALIALILALTSLGFWPAVAGLVLLGVPPILLNTATGLREADAGAVDAARGMGYTPLAVLTRVELPLALPLIWAGVRNSAVQIIATAALAGVVGAEGLGVIVQSGLANSQTDVLLAGAIPITILAALADGLCAGAERLTTGRGLRVARQTPKGDL
ncbi:MAG TPA: ABC transporter permease [Miltoncostaeaceae bacterium]|nr:ABC transporter permease [Miltoncostaeaceae bacterium]